ncbi:unnamed protein product, partial [Heterosigma akashiwo]
MLQAITLPYMDIEVYPLGNRFGTMSYAKPLNLYLYLPPSSAHPPGLLKGHIFGHIKKLYMQNTESGNFRRFTLLFFERLMARGHSRDQLIRLFNQALQHYCPTVEVLSKGRPSATGIIKPHVTTARTQLFFKVPFDPNGPSRRQLRIMMNTESL